MTTIKKNNNNGFNNIPEEILKIIFSHLDDNKRFKCRNVCKKWNKYINDYHKNIVNIMFKYLKNFGIKYIEIGGPKYQDNIFDHSLWAMEEKTKKTIPKEKFYKNEYIFTILITNFSNIISFFLFPYTIKYIYIQNSSYTKEKKVEEIFKIIEKDCTFKNMAILQLANANFPFFKNKYKHLEEGDYSMTIGEYKYHICRSFLENLVLV